MSNEMPLGGKLQATEIAKLRARYTMTHSQVQEALGISSRQTLRDMMHSGHINLSGVRFGRRWFFYDPAEVEAEAVRLAREAMSVDDLRAEAEDATAQYEEDVAVEERS